MNSYTKLKNGSWGVRVAGLIQERQQIQVQTKTGAVKTETVTKVLWTGPDIHTGKTISLCSIAPRSNQQGQGGRRLSLGGRYECEECGDMVTPGTRCWETGLTH